MLLWGILRHPRSTFEHLRDAGGKSWLVVALLAFVLTVLPILVAAPISSQRSQELIRAQLERQAGQSQEVSPEVQRQATQFSSNPLFTMVFPSLGGVLLLALGWLVWAGALHLLATILGGNNSFGQMFRAVVWSWTPYLLRGLLQTVYILATGQLIEHPGLSGLVLRNTDAADLIASPPSMGTIALGSFLSQVDIYLFWRLALLVIGVMVTARISTRKSLLLTLGVWALLTLVSLLPSLVAGSFAAGFSGM